MRVGQMKSVSVDIVQTPVHIDTAIRFVSVKLDSLKGYPRTKLLRQVCGSLIKGETEHAALSAENVEQHDTPFRLVFPKEGSNFTLCKVPGEVYTVSSDEPTTRIRILQAALALVEGGATAITMNEIAREAGLSRQALYLTFADKAALFIALLRYVDGRRGIVAEWKHLRSAENGVAALMAIIDRQARLSPAYRPLAEAFELLRRQDPAAEAAWQDRQSDRLEGCRVVARRLEDEGRLRPGLDVSVAADLIWSFTSSTAWDDLVVKRGWSGESYRKYLGDILASSLVK
jgi:AcrR family transcriptional regulator